MQTLTLNGKTIEFTGMTITGIQNSRVTFSDGSVCDISTGQITCTGDVSMSGKTIKLTAKGALESKTTPVQKFEPRVFDASELKIAGVDAEVEVAVGPRFTVAVEGDPKAVENLSIESDDKVVLISPKSRPSGFALSILKVGISIGRISIGKKAAAKIIVIVPRRTPVTVTDVNGDVSIGDTEGQVTVASSGVNDVTIGKVRDASLTAESVGSIYVKKVDGLLTVTTNGVGKVRIDDGDVSKITASATSVGGIAFNGVAQNAELRASGVGGIDVHRVVNTPFMRATSIGKVNVDNWR